MKQNQRNTLNTIAVGVLILGGILLVAVGVVVVAAYLDYNVPYLSGGVQAVGAVPLSIGAVAAVVSGLLLLYLTRKPANFKQGRFFGKTDKAAELAKTCADVKTVCKRLDKNNANSFTPECKAIPTSLRNVCSNPEFAQDEQEIADEAIVAAWKKRNPDSRRAEIPTSAELAAVGRLEEKKAQRKREEQETIDKAIVAEYEKRNPDSIRAEIPTRAELEAIGRLEKKKAQNRPPVVYSTLPNMANPKNPKKLTRTTRQTNLSG